MIEKVACRVNNVSIKHNKWRLRWQARVAPYVSLYKSKYTKANIQKQVTKVACFFMFTLQITSKLKNACKSAFLCVVGALKQVTSKLKGGELQ